MPTVNFNGYLPQGGVLFGWDREVVSTKRPATSGHGFTVLATHIRCKADGETMGLRVTQAGAFPAYERRFFFAVTYCKTGMVNLDVRNVLTTGDTIVDGDGVEWHVSSIANPAGADEHLQVIGHRAPVE